MNLIQNTILTSLPANRKKTPSGWISFNAPCCVYNGETADKKKRGGLMTSADGTVSYHCFNCGFKASYVIGRKLTYKMRQFMSYIGIPEDTIRKLAIEAMREEEGDVKYEKKKFVTFKNKTLPKNTHKLDVWLEKYVANDLTEPQWKKIDGLLKYLESRGIGADWYDFMYSPDKVWDVHQRLLIPFYWRGDVVGFTWNFGDGSAVISNVDAPTHIYDELGVYTIELTVEDAYGCFDTYSETIDVTKGYEIILPTAFTPNADGINDTMRPVFNCMVKIEMSVYDTWGSLLYFESGDTITGWDGTIDGNPTENGIYIIVVTAQTFNGITIEMNGPITLIK